MKLEPAVIKLADGRAVKFGRGEKVVKLATNEAVEFIARNGQSVTARPLEYAEKVRQYLLVYGVKQSGGDRYASADTPEECIDRVRAIIEAWERGEVGIERAAAIRDPDLVAAIVELGWRDRAEAEEFVRGLSSDEIAGFRQDPEIKPVVERLAADRALRAGVGITDKLSALKRAAESARG